MSTEKKGKVLYEQFGSSLHKSLLLKNEGNSVVYIWLPDTKNELEGFMYKYNSILFHWTGTFYDEEMLDKILVLREKSMQIIDLEYFNELEKNKVKMFLSVEFEDKYKKDDIDSYLEIYSSFGSNENKVVFTKNKRKMFSTLREISSAAHGKWVEILKEVVVNNVKRKIKIKAKIHCAGVPMNEPETWYLCNDVVDSYKTEYFGDKHGFEKVYELDCNIDYLRFLTFDESIECDKKFDGRSDSRFYI